MAERQKPAKPKTSQPEASADVSPDVAAGEQVIGSADFEKPLSSVTNEELMAELGSRLSIMTPSDREVATRLLEISQVVHRLAGQIGAIGLELAGAEVVSDGSGQTGKPAASQKPTPALLKDLKDPTKAKTAPAASPGDTGIKTGSGQPTSPETKTPQAAPEAKDENEANDESKGKGKQKEKQEEKESEKPEKESLLQQIDPELHKMLDEARQNYARLTAEDRQKYIGRFLESDSKGNLQRDTRISRLIARIPGVKRLAKFINRNHDRRFQEAISQYDLWLKTAVSQIVEHHRTSGVEADKLEQVARLELYNQSAELEKQIVDQRVRMAEAHGGAGFLTKHWVNGGKFKKAMMVFGIGATAGLVVGAGAALLGVAAGVGYGTIAGAGSGMLAADQVTRRRAAATFSDKNKESAVGGRTVAEYDSMRDRLIKSGIIRAGKPLIDEDGNLTVRRVTTVAGKLVEQTEQTSRESMARNSRRLRTAKAIGGIAGGLGAWGGQAAVEWVQGRDWELPSFGNEATDGGSGDAEPTTTPESTGGAGGDSSAEGGPDAGPDIAAPELVANDFYVEHGHGFIKEINQWATANGQSQLSGSESWNLYKALRSEFGDNGIITDLGTYVRSQGDLGIAAPGRTSWAEGVPEFLHNWLDRRSLWK